MNAAPWEGRKVDLPPPGGGYQVSGDSESSDIGPPETEYGRAIHCEATDSGTLRDDGVAGGGGGTGPPTMVGTARDRLEAGAGTGRKSGGSNGTRGRNCIEEDDDRDTRIGKGNGGGGVTGGQWVQWDRMERGGGLRPLNRRPEIYE